MTNTRKYSPDWKVDVQRLHHLCQFVTIAIGVYDDVGSAAAAVVVVFAARVAAEKLNVVHSKLAAAACAHSHVHVHFDSVTIVWSFWWLIEAAE